MNNPYGLPQWRHPDHYAGFSPDGDFLIYTKCRDSQLLTDCNYAEIERALEAKVAELGIEGTEPLRGGNLDTPWVYDFRASHWAVGWVEYLLVRGDAPDALQAYAAEILKALDAYPVFDDDAYSEVEWAEMCRAWGEASLGARVDWCRESGVSIFAARRVDEIPIKCDGVLRDYVNG